MATSYRIFEEATGEQLALRTVDPALQRGRRVFVNSGGRIISCLRFLGAVLFAVSTWTAGSAFAQPTFYKDILPIFQRNCQVCHRPGEIGPMPLLDYEHTRPWAKAIKAAVLLRKMPPWLADPQYGHFANDRRLSDRDVHAIAAWVDAGAPAGDPNDKPLAVKWRDGWNIRPDQVFQMPDPYIVPAAGTLPYIYVVIPMGFTQDTWVAAAEIRPGARSVVHHMLAVVRPPGSQWMKDAKPFVPYVPPANSESNPQTQPIDVSYELLAAYSPGMQAQRFDIDHSAQLVPAGSDLVLQLHYTANGKTVVQDQTKVGLELAKAPPAKRFMSAVVNSANWTIVPGDPNAEGHARLTFGEPVELVFMQPHMHLRGKDMTVRAVFPDGTSEILLSVPHYTFWWQIVYYLDQPRHLPAGTRIEVTAHWDNSANNPYNPDPTKTVRPGEQSWDEMLNVPMGVIVPRD